MAREKQHVFSARTTEEGLKALNEVKARLKVNWDEMVIEAVSAHYGLDKAMMTLPKKVKPAKEAENNRQPPEDRTDGERPTEAGEEKPAEETLARKQDKKSKKGTHPKSEEPVQ